MKIGEVAKLTGVGVEALRFYEKSGLLERPVRTYSGYRMYGEEVLERIAFIKRAQVLGFTLDEIGRLIAHKQKGESPCEEVREIVRIRLDELQERIKQMTRFRNELTATLSEWEKIGHADGHVCGLIENSHIKPVIGKVRKVVSARQETR
jgi:DNA-binding transcriptional MerR regulator